MMKKLKTREIVLVLCVTVVLLLVVLVSGHFLKSPEQRSGLVEMEVARGNLERAYWHARWVQRWYGGDEEFADVYPGLLRALARSERGQEAARRLLAKEENDVFRGDLMKILNSRDPAQPTDAD